MIKSNKKRGSIILSVLIIGTLIFGGFYWGNQIELVDKKITDLTQQVRDEPQQLSGFNPVGGLTYRLQTSAGSSANIINLSSLKNRSGIALTMTLIDSDIGYGTLSPQTSRSEFISFTGIIQNANGTAQLTGVSRGLSDIAPFTASTTLQEPHPGQSIFILSDSPQLFEEYAKIRSTTAITGQYNFDTVLPSSSLSATTSEQFVNKGLLDATAFQGAATSTETNGGLVELATQIEMASTTDGGVSVPRVLYSKYSTSTPDGTSQAGLFAIISKNNGKLHQLWIDLTEAFTWTGLHIFSATTTFNGDVVFNATTTQLGVTGGISPVGSIIAYASTTAPNGWLLADGTQYTTASFPNLFGVIGYSYGGSGANFNVPDIQNRNIIMASSTDNIGQTGGEQNHTMTTAELVAHTHGWGDSSSGGSLGNVSTDASATQDNSIRTSGSTGSGNAFNVLDPYIVLQYIIKY